MGRMQNVSMFKQAVHIVTTVFERDIEAVHASRHNSISEQRNTEMKTMLSLTFRKWGVFLTPVKHGSMHCKVIYSAVSVAVTPQSFWRCSAPISTGTLAALRFPWFSSVLLCKFQGNNSTNSRRLPAKAVTMHYLTDSDSVVK